MNISFLAPGRRRRRPGAAPSGCSALERRSRGLCGCSVWSQGRLGLALDAAALAALAILLGVAAAQRLSDGARPQAAPTRDDAVSTCPARCRPQWHGAHPARAGTNEREEIRPAGRGRGRLVGHGSLLPHLFPTWRERLTRPSIRGAIEVTPGRRSRIRATSRRDGRLARQNFFGSPPAPAGGRLTTARASRSTGRAARAALADGSGSCSSTSIIGRPRLPLAGEIEH